MNGGSMFLDMDGTVDFFDVSQVEGYEYGDGGTMATSYTNGDLNYDSVVDFFDLSVVTSSNYNSSEVF
jgi:hypothetical protein